MTMQPPGCTAGRAEVPGFSRDLLDLAGEFPQEHDRVQNPKRRMYSSQIARLRGSLSGKVEQIPVTRNEILRFSGHRQTDVGLIAGIAREWEDPWHALNWNADVLETGQKRIHEFSGQERKPPLDSRPEQHIPKLRQDLTAQQ